MQLHIETLLFASLSSRCSYLLVFTTIWLRQRKDVYMLHWATSIAMSMLGAWVTAKIKNYPEFPIVKGFFVYAVFGSSIALCWSGVRVYRGACLRWWELLVQACLPGLAYSGMLLLGLPPVGALVGMFAAIALNLVRAIAEVLAPGTTGRLWSQYVVAAPLLAYLLMILASMVVCVVDHQAMEAEVRASLSLIIDQGCSVLVYTGLLAMLAERAQESLKHLAASDPLTALPNRQGLALALERWAASRHRSGRPTGVALFDIDHFKRVNDTHGHGAGDAVLVEFARRARRVFARPQDIVVRWGGEEFLVVMPGMDRDGALRRADDLRAATAAAPFGIDGSAIAVTVSGGVAEMRGDGRDLDAAIARADAALYAAKRQGRDRVAVLDRSVPAEVAGLASRDGVLPAIAS